MKDISYKDFDILSPAEKEEAITLLSRYEQITNSVLLGDARKNGDYYYPNLDAQGRYAGFQHILFEKGDVILFSTRAIHALYPQRNDFMMHFIEQKSIKKYGKIITV